MCKKCLNDNEQQRARDSDTSVVILISAVALVLWYVISWSPLIEPEGFSWYIFLSECLYPGLIAKRNQARIEKVKRLTKEDFRRESQRLNNQILMQEFSNGAVKIILSFLQVLASFHQSFRIMWPNSLEFLFVEFGGSLMFDFDVLALNVCSETRPSSPNTNCFSLAQSSC